MALSCKPVLSRAAARPARAVRANVSAVEVITKVVVKDCGTYSVQGTVRKVNEDRWAVANNPSASNGQIFSFTGVYDGHGGSAVADWLKEKLFAEIEKNWKNGNAPQASITEAFLQADKKLLQCGGFLGLGERGIGGSKCGATAATVYLYTAKDGSTALMAANVGDARTLLVRDGKPVQLSVDHVPDVEEERKRIERYNPNPRMPLVRYIGGTWRVGGLLALSRAFGDAYLKGSLQFEGITMGSDGYSSGFGLTAEPHTVVETLTSADSYIVVSSDGLFAEEERGGGGGLDNDLVAQMLQEAGPSPDLNKLAKEMADRAVKVGSTDDVTVVILKLGHA